jgi:acetoin utilization deacetylase AcuC-like enzyme
LRILYSEKHLLHEPREEFDGKASLFHPHPEAPQRAGGILEALREQGLGEPAPPREYGPEVLTAVHDPGLIGFYRRVLPAWEARTGKPGPVLPDVFALRSLDRRPQDPVRQAGRDYYGRYCYLNNAALAARQLLSRGRPAVLDIDYHHGNGTQDIFYDSAEVLLVSLHADPDSSYP